jgi:hypothetical protein
MSAREVVVLRCGFEVVLYIQDNHLVANERGKRAGNIPISLCTRNKGRVVSRARINGVDGEAHTDR